MPLPEGKGKINLNEKDYEWEIAPKEYSDERRVYISQQKMFFRIRPPESKK